MRLCITCLGSHPEHSGGKIVKKPSQEKREIWILLKGGSVIEAPHRSPKVSEGGTALGTSISARKGLEWPTITTNHHTVPRSPIHHAPQPPTAATCIFSCVLTNLLASVPTDCARLCTVLTYMLPIINADSNEKKYAGLGY
jgi:hypothetical protein